ncbi:hypothetical protein [Rhizobium phaseoli]|uniref:hypothetical protein n=1 Tax=Rhizobium phaseoli TaxID=396 RepID=UPI00035D0D36|nr:hypothetical protein [Rhizobium phaseoli]KKZ83568.1 hypothetical protein RPHASCH2410_PD01385 [Rhizobium phaseoli Ch24-10]
MRVPENHPARVVDNCVAVENGRRGAQFVRCRDDGEKPAGPVVPAERIAFVISKHLCNLIINHNFADRLLARPTAVGEPSEGAEEVMGVVIGQRPNPLIGFVATKKSRSSR